MTKRFIFSIIFISLFSFSSLFSQTPEFKFVNGSSSSDVPLGGSRHQRMQLLYMPGDFGTTVPSGMAISTIYLRSYGNHNISTFSNFEVAIGQDTITSLTNLWVQGLIKVVETPIFITGPTIAGEWIEIELQSPFPFNPSKPLIIETRQTVTSGGINLLSGGTPVNSLYTGNTLAYGDLITAVPYPERNSFHFGFDLIPFVPDNAGVSSLDSIDPFCAGPKDIYVRVGNFGKNQLDSVEVHWEFNNVLQPSIKYTQLIDTLNGTNPSSALIKLGSKNFTLNTSNKIKVWTSSPNGVVDTVNLRDTLEAFMQAGLNGNYTINKALLAGNGNYNDFSSLAYDLNTYGICGPVHVIVEPGTYNEYFTLNEIAGSSQINTIIIDGLDSSTVLLTHDGTQANASISLNGADHVTIKNMAIDFTGPDGEATVLLKNGTEYNTISNCKITSTKYFNYVGVDNIVLTSSLSSNNVISNNNIRGGNRGIYMNWGIDCFNNKIINNKIRDTRSICLYIQGQDSLKVIGNTLVHNAQSSSGHWGALFYDSGNLEFSQNFLNTNGGVSINYRYSPNHLSSAKTKIINNTIISQMDGLLINHIEDIDIFHNSIYVKNSEPALTIHVDYYNNKKFDVRNNILYSNNSVALEVAHPDTIFTRLDNNLYNTNGNSLLSINSVNYSDLSAYQSASPFLNTASIEGDPEFVDPENDLHIAGTFVNNKGTNISSVTVDIDGDNRPIVGSTTVDIGSDEFDPPSCLPMKNIVIYDPGFDSVTVRWDGFGNLYEYQFVEVDKMLGEGIKGLANADSVRLGGLSSSTAYYFYVREICDRDDTSAWRKSAVFRTLNRIPYFENFNNFQIAGGPFVLVSVANGWGDTSTFFPKWNADTSTWFPSTGPSIDHTTGQGGVFIYLKDAPVVTGDSSELLSPPIYIDTNQSTVELSFWYHMYGSNMGDLKLFIDTNGVSNLVETISGQHQTSETDPWLKFSKFLRGYNGKWIKIKFRGIRGPGFFSDMAIDDVALNLAPPYNAGVIELIQPSSSICAGNIDPIVAVKNFGAEKIDSVKIVWDINGTIDSIWYRSTILSEDTAHIQLGNVNIIGSSMYNFTFYTEFPNGVKDTIPLDDTLKLENKEVGLSGAYSIDSSQTTSSSNFQSFIDLAEALNERGVCGPTTIAVVSGSGPYNNVVSFESVEGSNSLSWITINGNGETLQFDPADINRESVLSIENSSYISINDLVIDARGGTSGSGIFILGSSHHINIHNNHVLLDTSSSGVNFFGIASLGSKSNPMWSFGNSHSISITDNIVDGGYVGLYFAGGNNINNSYTLIEDNEVSNFYEYGILTGYNHSIRVSGNDIHRMERTNVTSNDMYGLYSEENKNSIFNNNSIHDTHDTSALNLTGTVILIHVYGDAPIGNENYFINNLVYNINSNNNITGIDDLGCDGTHFLNNTISLDFRSATGGNNIIGYQQRDSSANASFKNNLISINRGGSGIKKGIVLPWNSGTSMEIDYNNIYIDTNSTGTYSYGELAGISYTDLAAWQKGTGYDSNSYSVNPLYKDLLNNNFTPTNRFLDSAALSLPEVAEDFYGNTRSAYPDIGAIEFTPPKFFDLQLFSFLSPVEIAKGCYASMENIELRLVNKGDTAIDFSNDTTNINVSVSNVTSQNFNLELHDNSLNNGLALQAGDTLTVTMGTLDMTTVGTYEFKAFVNLDPDTIHSNDTISMDIANSTSGGSLTATADTLCGSENVTLNTAGSVGEIQWQRIVAGTFTDESGADSTSYEVFVDSTVTFRAVACGTEYSDTITVVVNSIPLAPTTTDDSINTMCGLSGNAVLTAVSGTSSARFNWYDAPTAGTLVASGDTLFHPFSSATTDPAAHYADTFYVAEVSNGCEGARAMAIAVISIEKPTAPTAVGDTAIVFCGDSGTAVLSASSVLAGADFNWYNDSNSTAVVVSGDTLMYGLNTSVQTATTIYSDTFYVSALDAVSSCESERSMVVGAVVCTVGGNEIGSSTSSLLIYPNPSKGIFNLIGKNVKEELEVDIYNTNGKIVYQMDSRVSNNFNKQIDLSGLSKGIYFIKLQGDQLFEMRKIIIH